MGCKPLETLQQTTKLSSSLLNFFDNSFTNKLRPPHFQTSISPLHPTKLGPKHFNTQTLKFDSPSVKLAKLNVMTKYCPKTTISSTPIELLKLEVFNKLESRLQNLRSRSEEASQVADLVISQPSIRQAPEFVYLAMQEGAITRQRLERAGYKCSDSVRSWLGQHWTHLNAYFELLDFVRVTSDITFLLLAKVHDAQPMFLQHEMNLSRAVNAKRKVKIPSVVHFHLEPRDENCSIVSIMSAYPELAQEAIGM